MVKKVLIAVILIFFGVAGTVSFAAYKAYRTKIARQNTAKAPQQAENIRVTIIEGWSIGNIAEHLEKQELVKKEVFLAALDNLDRSKYPFLANIKSTSSLEGFLFPDTYFLNKPTEAFDPATAEVIIAKMLENFSRKITLDMEKKAGTLNMSLHEIVTLASIIEKETGRNAVNAEEKQALDTERKIIAGIFYNRLRIGMMLQSDATVNFVTKKNVRQASLADISVDNPYNTYKYTGLPPGPICNPSLSSILAALNPQNSDYYFFLHKKTDGQAVYSKNFDEHVQNKNRFLR